LSIYVYLGESPDFAFLQIEDNFPVAELKNRIRKVLKAKLKAYDAKDLIVHTKDADNKLHLLDNAELELADALKCDSGQIVYVSVPEGFQGYPQGPQGFQQGPQGFQQSSPKSFK